jgi:hypothetical protein
MTHKVRHAVKFGMWIPLLVALLALPLALCVSGSAGAEGGEDGVGTQALMGTAFTYQGHLVDDGAPAEGSYDFRFVLYDASSGGSQVGSTVTRDNVTVAESKFTVQLDFGVAAFGGQARYLQAAVRPGASTGGYTALNPRQALTPVPYALYAARVAAHSHLGQTWSGTDNPLTLNGSFASPGYAPLSLSNSHADGDGLRVTSGDDGVQVVSAGDDGIQIDSVGGDGVYVDSAGYDGIDINSAAEDGVDIAYAGQNGVYIGETVADGVYVGSAGDDGMDVESAVGDGVEVTSAGDDGLDVEWATDDGVRVLEAGGTGVYVGGAAEFGVDARGDIAGGYFEDGTSGVWTYVAYGSRGIYTSGTIDFVGQHPTDPSKAIVYAALEGGEAGTYYRGTAHLSGGTATVTLPEHFSLVTEEEGLTVQVTPRADCNGLYVAEVTTRAIVVKELMGGTSDARFDFLIHGVRAEYAGYEVIRDAAEALPQEVMSGERAETGE